MSSSAEKAAAPRTAGSEAARSPAVARLQIQGNEFVDQAGQAFRWRGITAFRLAEMLARGREQDVVAYLDWARRERLTVVRVLLMARHLFQLTPQDGVAALPRLLQLAAERGLYVEAVLLADTGEQSLDLPALVKAAAPVLVKHPNALAEIANEPWHPTQDPRLHDPAYVASLARLLPATVPVALGSLEGHDGYAAEGTYATWHAPRSNRDGGWGHVVEIAAGASLPQRWQKPVISDEPIGAAESYVPGRRDNDPARFAAAAALTRLAGLGATFHYEGGLQARTPAGRERECFDAWRRGLDALAALPAGGQFAEAQGLEAIARVSGSRAVFGRVYEREAWMVAVEPGPELKVSVGTGWAEQKRDAVPGVTLIRLAR